ncbi:MAG: HDOD domain-containing protein [Thermotogota bacterium]
MSKVSISVISKKIEELPTPDFIVQRIINIASDPNSSVKDLNAAVLESPSLSAKILKLSNSAYYALPRKITKLSQAINILGFKTVRNLAMSIFTVKNFFRNEYDFFNTKKFWTHLMATAIGAELLAKTINFPEREEAFLAGLLHDLGKIAMSNIMPESFEMIIKVANHKKISFKKAEELLESYSHESIGKLLFKQWGLSDLIINSAGFHDSVDNLTDDNSKMIVQIIHIANITTNTLYYGYSGNFGIEVPDTNSWNNLGLNPKKYFNYVEALKKKIDESEEFMNIDGIVDDMEVDENV